MVALKIMKIKFTAYIEIEILKKKKRCKNKLELSIE